MSHSVEISTDFCFVLSQSTRLTDGRTDGQISIARPCICVHSRTINTAVYRPSWSLHFCQKLGIGRTGFLASLYLIYITHAPCQNLRHVRAAVHGDVELMTSNLFVKFFVMNKSCTSMQKSSKYSLNKPQIGTLIQGSEIPGCRSVFQTRNPEIVRDHHKSQDFGIGDTLNIVCWNARFILKCKFRQCCCCWVKSCVDSNRKAEQWGVTSVGSGSIGTNYVASIKTGSRDWDFANPES